MEETDDVSLKQFRITRCHRGERYPADDVVAREEPLEVRLNGQTLVYLMRLPGDDTLLAAGFCLSEGLVTERSQIQLIRHCADGAGPRVEENGVGPGNLVEIQAEVTEGARRFAAAGVVRTGCGGADLSREVDLGNINVEAGATFSSEDVARVPDLLLEGQGVFRVSGGTHGAGLFDSGGNMLVVKEDVGRHNAVDKVLGYMLMSGISPRDKGMMLSGRLSYEMVLKAARAGIPLVCSVSAPTALGVEVALETGVTTVGFLRGAGFNIYSHPERLESA